MGKAFRRLYPDTANGGQNRHSESDEDACHEEETFDDGGWRFDDDDEDEVEVSKVVSAAGEISDGVKVDAIQVSAGSGARGSESDTTLSSPRRSRSGAKTIERRASFPKSFGGSVSSKESMDDDAVSPTAEAGSTPSFRRGVSAPSSSRRRPKKRRSRAKSDDGDLGLGLLRLQSTFRHDLKIYASDEGRVQMTAAAFTKGLLDLEGELTPILVQMVKSANTNGLLDNDSQVARQQNGKDFENSLYILRFVIFVSNRLEPLLHVCVNVSLWLLFLCLSVFPFVYTYFPSQRVLSLMCLPSP